MKKTTTTEPELPALAEHTETSIATQEPSAGQLLQALIERGNPEENIGVLERLVALKERADEKVAERAFSRDFHALQTEARGVQALDEVPDKQGNVRYCFASYERIMEQVRPLLIKFGFSVRFDSEFKENRLVMRCILMHVDGHSTTTTQYMRVSAPYGANDSQADGATTTMAKRYSLCSALNVVIERDGDGGDGRDEGEPVDFAQAKYLEELVRDTKSDVVKFLRYAGAPTFAEISSKRYNGLVAELQRKACQ